METITDRWIGSSRNCWRCKKPLTPIAALMFAFLGHVHRITREKTGMRGATRKIMDKSVPLFGTAWFCGGCAKALMGGGSVPAKYLRCSVEDAMDLSPLVRPCSGCRATPPYCDDCKREGWVAWHSLDAEATKAEAAKLRAHMDTKRTARPAEPEKPALKRRRRGAGVKIKREW